MALTTTTPPARWLDPEQTLGSALSSDGQTLYKVTRDGDRYTCECVAWTIWHRCCRHVKTLAAQLPEPAAPRPAVFWCIDCARVAALDGDIRCRDCAAEHARRTLHRPIRRPGRRSTGGPVVRGGHAA